MSSAKTEGSMQWRTTLAALMFLGTLAVTAAAQPAQPAGSSAAPSAPALSETLRLKGELAKALAEIETLKGQLAAANLRAMAGPLAALENEFLAAVQAPAGSTWDWSRMAPRMPPSVPPATSAKPPADSASSSGKPVTP